MSLKKLLIDFFKKSSNFIFMRSKESLKKKMGYFFVSLKISENISEINILKALVNFSYNEINSSLRKVKIKLTSIL